MPGAVRRSVERVLELPAAPDAVPPARGLLREVLGGSALAHRLEDGELALSELVTNAVLHGRDPLLVRFALTDDVLPGVLAFLGTLAVLGPLLRRYEKRRRA